ncbi:MAG: 4'-phosphopantetheinyl transferase superfamily protein [Spirochaetaceae bacterium]|nr:4'-phosphopantetheinyl transferase superfamily protein [Spirochaetaceae bacterium]
MKEMMRADNFIFEKSRDQYIICRALLKSILGEKLHIKPHKIELKYNKYGKPELPSALNRDNLQFNVSHSGDYGIIAVTEDRQVGIDIEKWKDMNDQDLIIKSQFSDDEYKIYSASTDKTKCFFDIWVQKEALIKASGLGFSFGLSQWSVDPERDEYFIEAREKKYHMKKLNICEGYSTAFAISE